MKVKHLSLCAALAVAVAIVACSKSNPTSPSSSSTTASATGADSSAAGSAQVGTASVSITTPAPVTPTNGQKFRYADQPLTLTVRNAAATGGAVTYTFQVASDAGFANIVSTKDGVAQGGNGQTSVQIDVLAGAANYYFRVRANAGGGPGLFSRTVSFNVGPQVVIQAPTQVSPGNGGTSNGSQPTLTVNDASRTGPAGPITYRFEVSDSSSFTNLVSVAPAVAEQPGQTTASMSGQFVANGTYYWRVRADDATNGVSSPFSSASSFKYVPFDMRQAIIMNSPHDLADWAQTGTITSIVFTPDAFLVDFDKRDGPDRWPDTPFGAGSLEYTLGMCLNLNSQWYCSAVVQFWYGRELSASTPPWNVATAWFYDPARWGPMAGHQPQDGETVGIFACAGNCRNNTAGDASYVKERTNVALIPWTNEADESFSFTPAGLVRTLMRRHR